MLVPRGHPLEGRRSIGFADVYGQRMAMSSERHSPQGVRRLFGPFLAAGAIPFEVAEFEREALVRIAARNQLLVLCCIAEAPPHVGEVFVARPIGANLTTSKYLARRTGFATPAAEAFWAMAKLAAEAEPKVAA